MASLITYLCLLVVFDATGMSAASAASASSSSSSSAVSKSAAPPVFFLRDPQDDMCLGQNGKFKRCGIDTLWFVEGNAGNFFIHSRPVEEGDRDVCLNKASCHLSESALRVFNCDHCGSKKWDIEEAGDGDGYFLTQDKGRYCVVREEGNEARTADCNAVEALAFKVSFLKKRDLDILSSEASRLVAAAADGDLDAIKELVEGAGSSKRSGRKGLDVNSKDHEKRTALSAAAAEGHLDVVKYLVSKGADVFAVDSYSMTALMEAVVGHQNSVVEYLLTFYKGENKGKLEAAAESGSTALWFAVASNFTDTAKLLLAEGADPNCRRSDDIPALFVAIASGYVDVFKVLLEYGADVHMKNRENVNAVTAACENEETVMLNEVLKLGVDANVMTVEGLTPLLLSASSGNFEAIKLLIEKGGVDPALVHPEQRISALMYAASMGRLDIVNYLLPLKGVRESINDRHMEGGTALSESVAFHNAEIFITLYEAGGDATMSAAGDISMLMLASSQGNADVVRFMVENVKGIDVEQRSKTGGTALMYAAAGGHTDVIKILIEKGHADINAVVRANPDLVARVKAKKLQNETVTNDQGDSTVKEEEEVIEHADGGTALTVASEIGQYDSVVTLVELGANVAVVCEDNMTAVLYSFAGGFPNITEYLIEHGGNPNDAYIDEEGNTRTLLRESILRRNGSLALSLVEHGADLDCRSPNGRDNQNELDCVALASSRGLAAVVDAILDREEAAGVVKSKSSDMALLLAIHNDHPDVVKILLNRGRCDVNARDEDQTTALMLAAARGLEDIVTLLLGMPGIDLDAQNVEGHTALMFAYHGKGQVDAVIERSVQALGDSMDAETLEALDKVIASHKRIIHALVAKGANPDMKDHEGKVARDFAALGSEAIVEHLRASEQSSEYADDEQVSSEVEETFSLDEL